MSNILRIARRQVHSIRDKRYAVTLLGLVAVLGIVSVLGARHHAAREADHRARQQGLVERQWLEQPNRHPHRVIHYGFLLFREEAPLAFFDPGVSPWAGTSLFLEGHRQNSGQFRRRPPCDNGGELRTPDARRRARAAPAAPDRRRRLRLGKR